MVYNALRLAGRAPSGASWPSLAIGGAAGLAVLGLVTFARSRLIASGRLGDSARELPPPAQLTSTQRTALNVAWPALAALAAVALAMGAYLAVDWLQADPGGRARTTLVLGGWNLLMGLFFGDEALRMRRGEAEGIDSIVLACGLTAVLAGVGFSRELIDQAQVLLIVLSGVAGVLTGFAVWALRGARGLPVGAVVVGVVAALSLILPLAL